VSTALEYAGMALVLWAVWLIGGHDVAGKWVMLAAHAVWLVVIMAHDTHRIWVLGVMLAGLTPRAISVWGGM
jgi:hypothetical protein